MNGFIVHAILNQKMFACLTGFKIAVHDSFLTLYLILNFSWRKFLINDLFRFSLFTKLCQADSKKDMILIISLL